MSKNTGFSITSAERYSLALFELSEENDLLSQIEDQSISLLNLTNQIKTKEHKKFNFLIEKRRKKMPVAYILGYKDFWKSKFFINNHVLIPRPETELIVEESLNFLPKHKSKRIMDIGTGSGCIIISLLKERPCSSGVGLDI